MMCSLYLTKILKKSTRLRALRAFAVVTLILSVAGCSPPESETREEAPSQPTVATPQRQTLTFLPKPTDFKPEGMRIPDIVAKFGETEITREQYIDEMERWQKQFDAQANMVAQKVGAAVNSLPLPPNERQNALNVLIGKVLLLELATEAGIEVLDAEVERKVAEGKAKLTDATSYQTYLSWYEFDEAQLRREIREKIIRERYVEQNTPNCEFTDEQVAAVYERYVTSGKMEGPENADFWSLVVNVDADATEKAWNEAEAKVRAARARVKEGEFFGKVAQEVSTDPSVKRNGGFYERIIRDTLTPAIEDMVFTAELEVLGEPFRAKYGWQFVRVMNRREEGTRLLSDAEQEIYDSMVTQCKALNAQVFVRSKAKEVNLEVFYSVPEANKAGSF